MYISGTHSISIHLIQCFERNRRASRKDTCQNVACVCVERLGNNTCVFGYTY